MRVTLHPAAFPSPGGVGGLLSLSTYTNGTLNGTHLVSYDGNGNVVALLEASTGNEIARYEYGPFGESIRVTEALANLNPFRFSTKYEDPESGLLYYGYRYYSASTGRWLSRDPVGELGGLNLYGFVGSEPTDEVDPYGLTNQPGDFGWGQYSVTRPYRASQLGFPFRLPDINLSDYKPAPEPLRQYDAYRSSISGAGPTPVGYRCPLPRPRLEFGQMQRALGAVHLGSGPDAEAMMIGAAMDILGAGGSEVVAARMVRTLSLGTTSARIYRAIEAPTPVAVPPQIARPSAVAPPVFNDAYPTWIGGSDAGWISPRIQQNGSPGLLLSMDSEAITGLPKSAQSLSAGTERCAEQLDLIKQDSSDRWWGVRSDSGQMRPI